MKFPDTRAATVGVIATLLAAHAGAATLGNEPWIAPGDMRVRHDVQLLVDSGVIELPVSYWPIAASDLAHALATPAQEGATGRTPAQLAAIARLQAIAREGRAVVAAEIGGAARPMEIRLFDDTPREEGELSAYVAGFFGERWGGRLEVTGAVDPDDDEEFRLDGSYVAGKFGNWIVTAGAQDRWWGPGWEGSLILSSNARPVPAIALDRAVSQPFESKWLSWIGPWRLTTFMGQMEDDRGDYDRPLLWGMRISARPWHGLEISVDRTAQWCGEGRSCTWSDFWNVVAGNDNAGENVNADDEPGNQLASWEVRWASPIGDAPYLLYIQHTGEAIDNKLPRPYRTLDLAGAEIWGDRGSSGDSWRVGFEWAQTRCSGTEDGNRLWDCAYNNAIFTDGYRYRGRVMGHPMDGDGQMYSLRYLHVAANGNTLAAVLRHTLVNEGGGVPDASHSIAPGPETWTGIDLSYRRPLGLGWLEAGVGGDYRDREWSGDDATLARGWLKWTRPFN